MIFINDLQKNIGTLLQCRLLYFSLPNQSVGIG